MTDNLRRFETHAPQLGPGVYIDPSALIIGAVQIGADSSIWPMTVVRGDINHITIGARSNVQDGSVLHVTHDSRFHRGGFALGVGNEVTIGHRVILHGCEIGDQCLIGMGSIIMDGAVLEPRVMLGAGSLVAPGKVLQGGYLWLGSPARRIRPLSPEELEQLAYSAAHYVRVKQRYAVPPARQGEQS